MSAKLGAEDNRMTTNKNYFIPESDLALLERCVPLLHELCCSLPAGYKRPDIQVAIEECKRILSDVRWGYGPFLDIEIVPARPPEPELD